MINSNNDDDDDDGDIYNLILVVGESGMNRSRNMLRRSVNEDRFKKH